MNHSLRLLVVELQVHAVVYLVVLQLDVVLEDGVPLLQDDLVPPDNIDNKDDNIVHTNASSPGSRLGRDQFLQVADGVVLVALDPHLLPQPVVDSDLYHCRQKSGKKFDSF